MRYWILVLIILVNYSCEKCTCNMVRRDVLDRVFFLNRNTNDSILFIADSVLGIDFLNNPYSAAPKKYVDSVNYLLNHGYVMEMYTAFSKKYVDCDKCNQTLQYNKENECIQL